jgi:hypothetical protein
MRLGEEELVDFNASVALPARPFSADLPAGPGVGAHWRAIMGGAFIGSREV